MKPGDLVRIHPMMDAIGGKVALVLETRLNDPRLDDRVLVILDGRRRYMFKRVIEVISEG